MNPRKLGTPGGKSLCWKEERRCMVMPLNGGEENGPQQKEQAVYRKDAVRQQTNQNRRQTGKELRRS